MKIVESSVNNPMFGHLLTLFLIIGGIVAALNLKRETFPETSLDIVSIACVYPNASPEEVEDLLTTPFEEELVEIEEIKTHSSLSMEGLSLITIEMDKEAKDKQQAIMDIQRNIDQVRLPDGAEDPEFKVITSSDPVVRIAITGGENEQALRIYVDKLRTQLEAVYGVSSVSREGWRDEEYWVEVNPEKLADLQLSLSEVVSALRLRNVTFPGGKVPAGSEEIVLRTVGKFMESKDIEKVVVRSNTDGRAVLVGDIASVKRTFEPDAAYTKVEGEKAIVLTVIKKNSGDIIDIAKEAKEIIALEQERVGESYSLIITDDTSFYVKRRLDVVSSNGLIGIVLVLICLLFFLDFRVALYTAAGIPFAFLGAILFMSFLGLSINLMTMFGMIIVLGMLVDDSIIVGENIFRHLEEGMSPHDAAILGGTEVSKPVVATILTTIAAFAPLFFAPDLYSKFLGWLSMVVIITLIASLIECLIVMPTHAAEFSKPIQVKDAASDRHHRLGHRIMDGIVKNYLSIMKRCIKWRYLLLFIVAAGFFMFVGIAKKNVRVEIFPGDLIDLFSVKVTAPSGSSLETTDRLCKEIENIISQIPEQELDTYVTYIGKHISLDGGGLTQGSNLAHIYVYLTPQNLRNRLTKQLLADVRVACKDIAGVDRLDFELVKPGPPVGKAIEVKVVGNNFETLVEITGKVEAFLAGEKGVMDIGNNFLDGKQELHIKVDDNEAARLGLNLQHIATEVFTAFQGLESTIVREGKEEVAVRVRLQEPWRSEEASLEKLQLLNRAGRLISLDKVANFESIEGLPNITHFEGTRSITVGANIDVDATSSAIVNISLLKEFENISQEYPGNDIIMAGEGEETRKIADFAIKAFGTGILLIYMILALQLNSFFQPFILLTSIPLGLIGVVVALILHDKPVSIMAMMGMVGLAGVVVNDAIVLVTFINNQRNKGVKLYDALLIAGQQRFRPIILTTITTVAGLFPVIYGWGGYEPFLAPAAIALAYGLIFATFLTLVVVPCTYHVFVDVKHGILRLFGRKNIPD